MKWILVALVITNMFLFGFTTPAILGSFRLSSLSMALAALALPLVAVLHPELRRGLNRLPRDLGILLAFVAWTVVTAIRGTMEATPDALQALTTTYQDWGTSYNVGVLARTLPGMFTGVVIYLAMRRTELAVTVVTTLLVAGLASVILGVVQAFTGGPYFGADELQTQYLVDDVFVVKGLFPRESTFGAHMVFLIPILGARIMEKRNLATRAAWSAVLILTLMTAFMAGNRAGLVASLVAIIAFAWFARFSVSAKLLTVGVVVLLSAVSQVALPLLGERPGFLVNLDNPSFTVRFDMARAGFGMMREHPVLGVGLGNYPLFVESYVGREKLTAMYAVFRAEDENFVLAHNAFARIAAEQGVVGLALFAAVIVSTFRRFHRVTVALPRGPDREAVSLLFAVFVGYVIGGSQRDYSGDFELWMFVGIAAALASHARGALSSTRTGPRQRFSRSLLDAPLTVAAARRRA